jgi:hypothetical protein
MYLLLFETEFRFSWKGFLLLLAILYNGPLRSVRVMKFLNQLKIRQVLKVSCSLSYSVFKDVTY